MRKFRPEAIQEALRCLLRGKNPRRIPLMRGAILARMYLPQVAKYAKESASIYRDEAEILWFCYFLSQFLNVYGSDTPPFKDICLFSEGDRSDFNYAIDKSPEVFGWPKAPEPRWQNLFVEPKEFWSVIADLNNRYEIGMLRDKGSIRKSA